MEWEDFSYASLQEVKPTLDRAEYQIVVDETIQGVEVEARRNQYELVGAMRLKLRLIRMLEWQLGLDQRAVADMLKIVTAILARSFGVLLAPIMHTGDQSDQSELLGTRMIGFLATQVSRKQADRVISKLVKNLQLPKTISFETALAIHGKPAAIIERISFHGELYPDLYQIVTSNGTCVQGSSRNVVERTYLEQQYGTDLRELKLVPRYRRHHAPARWATWLLPDEFATYWQFSDQDAMDLMDDSPEHSRDRWLLERMGEVELRATLLSYGIRFSDYTLHYQALCTRVARVLVMPGYVQYPEDREDFLRQLVGFWYVQNQETLPAVMEELKRHRRSVLGTAQGQKNNFLTQSTMNSVHDFKDYGVNLPPDKVNQLANSFERVRNGGKPQSFDFEVSESVQELLEILKKLGSITSVEWYGRGVQLADVQVITPFFLQLRQDSNVDVKVFGMHVPKKSRYLKPDKRVSSTYFRSLYQAGVQLERTDIFEQMGSVLQLNYPGQTIIMRSAPRSNLAFAKRGRKHQLSMSITISTYEQAPARSIATQKLTVKSRAVLRQTEAVVNQTKVTRYGNPKALNTKDYFRQRLAEVTDKTIKNRLEEWMKYAPDKIQQNIKVVNQPYFALEFESARVIILDSFEPKNAYFVFYDKPLREVVSRVIHLRSKAAVLKFSSMVTRGYHDTEPIKLRAQRIFNRRL